MRASRPAIVAILLLGALLLFCRQRQQLAELRERSRAALRRADQLNAEALAAHSELLERSQGEEQVRIERNKAQRLLSQERAARTEPRSERLWSEPPRDWPAWQAQSPYVWVAKDALKNLPITPFEPSGQLTRNMTEMLALDEETLRTLNGQLREVVAAYQALEAFQAVLSTNHLEKSSGEAITVLVQADPASAARYEEEFKAALAAHLTPQQFDILTQLGSGWMSQTLQTSGQQPKTYSVARRDDGSFSITVKRGEQWMSTSGNRRADVNLYIPKHLQHFFSELREAPGDQ